MRRCQTSFSAQIFARSKKVFSKNRVVVKEHFDHTVLKKIDLFSRTNIIYFHENSLIFLVHIYSG